MNRRQKEVQQVYLDNEKAVVEKLKEVYRQAIHDCEQRILQLNARRDLRNLQSIIYQKQYQQALKKELEGILDILQTNEFDSVAEYLVKSYEDGFIGTLYDLQGQGIPLIFPIDERQIVSAAQIDSKLSVNLYAKLGEDISVLKRNIQSEMSRGIANGSSWFDIAYEIARGMNSPYKKALNNAIRIARTEGGRVQSQAQLDTLDKAAKCGADVVKQWDSTLDGRTRPEHAKVDGQIREKDEDFDVWGEKLKAPRIGGSARNVVNCRCQMLQRARWTLDDEETKYFGHADKMTVGQLKPIANKLGISVDELRKYSDQIIPVSAKNYEDFRRQYEKIWNYNPVARSEKSDIIGFSSQKLLETHYNKHSVEFGKSITKEEYVTRANNLLRLSKSRVYDDVHTITRSDGSQSIYRSSTNEFLVVTKDGNIRTYFKPTDGREYWKYEIERNKD